jgi:hypothetical protein
MSVWRTMRIALVVGIVSMLGVEVAEMLTPSGSYSVISSAEAVVGRPLTPVSVAGVARRTARRCRAGVYNC